MKKVLISQTITLLSATMLWATSAFAVPVLQLDIANGQYDTSTETIVATENPSTLYALLTPGGNENKWDIEDEWFLNQTYKVSIALSPKVGPTDVNLGSFEFAGQTINATEDMVYGVPPEEEFLLKDRGDLPGHGIFYTFFYEYEFSFDKDQTTETYNAQDNPGGINLVSDGDSYYMAFDFDTSLLDPEYILHFDLYATKSKTYTCIDYTDVDIRFFAPFSHDAESSTPVPEPATMLLFGVGLVGVSTVSLRKKMKS